MFLLILLSAAVVSTIMWLANVGKRIYIHVLSLILWSSVLMFTVDKVFSLLTGEDGGFIEFSGESLTLGLVLTGSAIIVWLIYVVTKFIVAKSSRRR